MEAERKKQHIALPAALAAALLLFLAAGGVYFMRYLERQIYEERTNQLVEITSQVQTNLDNALDSQGNCYDTGGKRGVWSDLNIPILPTA